MADLIPAGTVLKTGKSLINAKMEALDAKDTSLQQQISAEQQARVLADSAHVSALVAHSAAQISLAAVSGMTSTNLQAAIAEQSVRIANIVGQTGSGNTEIVDGRLGADGVARSTIGALIREIHAKLLTAAIQNGSLKHGMNLITTDQGSELDYVINGRTLVNVMGNYGNAESVAGWSSNQSTNATSTAAYVYGTRSIQVTATAAGTCTVYRNIVGLIDPTKYYVVLVDTKNVDASSCRLYVQVSGGNTLSGNGVTNTVTFETSYAKIAPTDLAAMTAFYVHGYIVATAAGQSAYFDGFRVYEIDAATYAKIGVDSEYTSDKLAAKYPYVDGVKHLTNPGIRLAGKNLMPPFTEIDNRNAGGTIIVAPYQLQIDSTGTVYNSTHDVEALPNQAYSFKIRCKGRVIVTTLDANKNEIARWRDSTNNTDVAEVTATFTTGATTKYIRVFFTNTVAGSFTFIEPMLALGSTIPDFEPQKNDYAYVPVTLASSIDGSVRDSFDSRLGQVLRRWKTDVLLNSSVFSVADVTAITYGTTSTRFYFNTGTAKLPTPLGSWAIGDSTPAFVDSRLIATVGGVPVRLAGFGLWASLTRRVVGRQLLLPHKY
jgi:hypothetical protein